MGIDFIRNGEFPIAKYDKKGRLVCPTCEFVTPIPDTHWLGRGIGTCPNTAYSGGPHKFFITDDIAYAINDIRSKSDASGEQKRLIRNFEETPDAVKPKEDGGKIIIP
jgi:hypothetical protein